MTYVEQAIQSAVEGGWKPGLVTDLNLLTDEGWINVVHHAGFRYENSISKWVIDESNFLDPLFWQALGKSLGWENGKATTVFQVPARVVRAVMGKGEHRAIRVMHRKAHTVTRPTRNAKTLWKRTMHDFIDHLIAGKDAESFFANLLNKRS